MVSTVWISMVAVFEDAVAGSRLLLQDARELAEGAARRARQRLQRAPGETDENGDPNLLLSPGPDFLSPESAVVNVQLKKIRKRREMRKQQETNAAEVREATGSFISPSVPVIVARARRARETERRGRNCTRMFGRLLLSALILGALLFGALAASELFSARSSSMAAPILRALRGEAPPAPAPTLCLPAPGDCRWSWRRMRCHAPAGFDNCKGSLKRLFATQRKFCEFA